MTRRVPEFRLGIVGAGDIAGRYVDDLRRDPNVTVKGVTDTDKNRGEQFAKEHDLEFYPSLDALLGDAAIDLVVNLTVHHAHFEVNKRCLQAGKHLFSEKPLALKYSEAAHLVELARTQGVRLGVAPFTLLYDTLRSAWQQVRAGRLGTVRLVYAEANWGRVETWHPHPQPYYRVGPLADVGVYPLTILSAMFGPVREVTAHKAALKKDRRTLAGAAFTPERADFWLCLLEHSTGVLTRLTANFYVTHSSKQNGIELHGDERSLFVSNWLWPYGSVETADFNEPYRDVLRLTGPENVAPWGAGVRDMVRAMLADEPHLATGEHAAHVVEVLEAAQTSAEKGESCSVHSDFTPPTPPGPGF